MADADGFQFVDAPDADDGGAAGEAAISGAERNGEPKRVLHSDSNIEQFLISQWGEEAYFDSAFYKAFLIERDRQQRLEPIRKAFLKSRA